MDGDIREYSCIREYSPRPTKDDINFFLVSITDAIQCDVMEEYRCMCQCGWIGKHCEGKFNSALLKSSFYYILNKNWPTYLHVEYYECQ